MCFIFICVCVPCRVCALEVVCERACVRACLPRAASGTVVVVAMERATSLGVHTGYTHVYTECSNVTHEGCQ